MEKITLYQKFKKLPVISQNIIILSLVVGTGLIVYKIYDSTHKTTEEKKDKELISAVDKEVNDWKKQGQKPTYQPTDYLQYAESIHDAIKVCAGDDYSNAENILKKMKNNLDVVMLIKAYGVRTLYCFGIPTSDKGLFSAIRSELGAEWGGITSYRIDRINSDWKKKGITYQI